MFEPIVNKTTAEGISELSDHWDFTKNFVVLQY